MTREDIIKLAESIPDPRPLKPIYKESWTVYPEYLMQVAAYAKAYEETTGNVIDGGYHILRFSKENGGFGHHFYPSLDDDAWPAFLHTLALYELNLKLKKRAA